MLERVIRDDPAAFLRTVAQILPKEIDVNAGSDFDGMESVPDILQKVAEEAGEEAALCLAKAFGLEQITDAPEFVSTVYLLLRSSDTASTLSRNACPLIAPSARFSPAVILLTPKISDWSSAQF